MLSDFNPKGAVAKSYGAYLEEKGITDRATVIIDAKGVVRYAQSVTPAGKRDMRALLQECEKLNDGAAAAPTSSGPGLAEDAVLYVKAPCTFSRWALSAKTNLHLDSLPVKNVSEDAEAKKELEARGGKSQAPALFMDGKVQYESADIIRTLVERTLG